MVYLFSSPNFPCRRAACRRRPWFVLNSARHLGTVLSSFGTCIRHRPLFPEKKKIVPHSLWFRGDRNGMPLFALFPAFSARACPKTHQALRNVHLTPRETSVLQRRFATAGKGGIDLAAVMLFFGRDQGQPRPATSEFSDNRPGEAVASSGQEEEGERREEGSRKSLRQTEDEEERSASEVEV